MGYAVTRQAVNIPPSGEFGAVKDRTAYNLIATKKGTSLRPRMLIVGAHYDTKVGMDNWHDHGPARPARTGTPGANDNASGVAALLETARALTATPTLHDVCLVAYANEEPPFYQTPSMGSVVHAKSVARHPGKDRIIGMIALETLGCYSPRVNKNASQPWLPDWPGCRTAATTWPSCPPTRAASWPAPARRNLPL